MKKLLNSPDSFIDEMLEGIYLAYPEQLRCVGGDPRALVRAVRKPGKVGLATGGGSGHLPLFLGYVGEGMLDGCSVGEIFQSSGADQMHAVTKEIDTGAGVLYIYGNYNGDKFNFQMAAEMAAFEDGIQVETVIGRDDISAADPEIRRGIAGIFFVYKCAGAAADEMLPLGDVARIAQKAADRVHTISVGLSPCVVPRVGHPTFELGENEMEIGVGIHGEPGVRLGPLEPADAIVDEMTAKLLQSAGLAAGDEIAILINGLGATPLEEQFVVYRRAAKNLAAAGLKVLRTYIGEYATSLEMAGVSISVFKLDGELKRLLAKPADTPFFAQHQLNL